MASFLSFFTKKPKPSIPAGPDIWSSSDHQRYPQWLDDIINYGKTSGTVLHPAVTALGDLIERNPRIKLLASGMCDELAARGSKKSRSSEVNIIRHYHDLLQILNYMLRVPPLWNTHMFMLGLEGAPFYLLLLHPMHTTCGFAFFQDPDVNAAMKNILDAWGSFLGSPESASCLDDSANGWFGPEACTHVVTEANVEDEFRNFEDIFVCDPMKLHHGFNSWDGFFTRQFREGVRPVADPSDDNVVANVCEAQPWRVAYNVQYEDKFWAKGGSYSVREMLACDELSWNFIGGTVYQAYLSALAYHRWHAPVTGRIVRAFNVPGLYFSEPPNHGFGRQTHNTNNSSTTSGNDINWAQTYLSAVATRTVIFIEADNPHIGLVAVILIGMSEVSTCELTVTPGQRIEKGEQLGMFHYGGSTHCVLFRHGVDLEGLPDPQSANKNLPLRSQLARVVPHRRPRTPEYCEKVGL